MKLKAAAFALAIAFAAPAEARTWRIEGGQSAALVEALAQARPEDVIRLERGIYALTQKLVLNAARVEVHGAGAAETILNFQSAAPGPAFEIAAAGVTIEGFTIQDAQGDAIDARQCNGLQLNDIRVAWQRAAPAGASGVHVAGCSNVLIEQTNVSRAPFAGIFLEGARNAILNQNVVRSASIGLALGNAGAIDATANEVSNNSIGIAVFDIPAMAQSGGVRLFQNTITGNNSATMFTEEPFASVPSGLGVLVMGARNVFVTDNDIGDHGSANVLIIAYPGSVGAVANFNPLSRNVMVRDNRFGAVGAAPQGALTSLGLGAPAPDVIWDGADTYFSSAGPRTDIPRVVMRDNRSSRGGIGAFVSLGLSSAGMPFSEAAPDRAFPPLVDLGEPERVRIN